MRWVLYLHVVLGAVWLGGVMYQETLVVGSLRQGREAYVRTSLSVGVNNARIYPPVTILLMVTAIWMIIANHLGWGTGWIIAAIALWVIGVAVGIAYFAPTATRLADRLEKEGVTDDLYAAVAKMHRVERADLILLLALLVLMIFKPGS